MRPSAAQREAAYEPSKIQRRRCRAHCASISVPPAKGSLPPRSRPARASTRAASVWVMLSRGPELLAGRTAILSLGACLSPSRFRHGSDDAFCWRSSRVSSREASRPLSRMRAAEMLIQFADPSWSIWLNALRMTLIRCCLAPDQRDRIVPDARSTVRIGMRALVIFVIFLSRRVL